MPKFMTKKRAIIVIISILIAILACIIYFISLPFIKAYAYHDIIDSSVNEFNYNHSKCVLKEKYSSRYPLLTSGISGYNTRYDKKCSKSEEKLYDELYVRAIWSPYSDFDEKYESRMNKGGNYIKADFNNNCFFLLTAKTGVSLNCYRGATEYKIQAHPIINYDRNITEIREHLKELHELIWQQLDENSENR